MSTTEDRANHETASHRKIAKTCLPLSVTIYLFECFCDRWVLKEECYSVTQQEKRGIVTKKYKLAKITLLNVVNKMTVGSLHMMSIGPKLFLMTPSMPDVCSACTVVATDVESSLIVDSGFFFLNVSGKKTVVKRSNTPVNIAVK